MHLEKDLEGDRDLTMAKKKHLGILRPLPKHGFKSVKRMKEEEA